MEIAALIISFAVLVVSGGAAIAAVVQAKVAVAARDDAERAEAGAQAARDETRALTRTATAAAVEQAKALQERNEIERAKLPRIEAAWKLEHIRASFGVNRTIPT